MKGHNSVSETWTGPSTTLRCPYCGALERNAWEVSTTTDETTCGSCGRVYEIDQEAVRYWRTRRKPTPLAVKCEGQGLPPGILASPRQVTSPFAVRVTDALPNEKDKP